MKLKNRFTGILLPVKSLKIYKYIFIIIYLYIFIAQAHAGNPCQQKEACRFKPPFNTLIAAADTSAEAIKVGELLPETLWRQPLTLLEPSGKESTRTLADWKGQLILLDFWATWCGSCLKHFPDVQALQQKYPNDLKVLLVNAKNSMDKKAKILGVMKNKSQTLAGGFSVPTVIGDIALRTAFPHYSIPHYVWIGKDGVVKAITSAEEVTDRNVEQVLKQNQLSTYGKVDVSHQQPLYTVKELPKKNLVQYSILLKGKIDGLGGGARPRKINDTLRGMVFNNRSLLNLYEMAARRQIPGFSSKRTIVSVPDSSQLFPMTQDTLHESWDRVHLYSFELIVPPGKYPEFYPRMLAELNNSSGYTGTITTRALDCWILEKTGETLQNPTRGGAYLNTLNSTKGQELRNANSNDLCAWLESLTGPNIPVLNETQTTQHIDLRLDSGNHDLESVAKQLATCGLNLRKTSRTLPVLLITANP